MDCDFTAAVLMPMSCCLSALILTWIRPPTSVTVPLSSTSKGTISMPIESFPGLSEISLGLMVERYMIFFLGAGAFLAAAGFSCVSTGTSFIPQMGQSPGLSDV